MTHKLIVIGALVVCLACEGTSVGNPTSKDPVERECDARVTTPLSGEESDILMGAGGMGGTVQDLLTSVDGTYVADIEWMADDADPKTTSLEVKVQVVGTATLYGPDPAEDDWYCDDTKMVGFPMVARLATLDGRLSEVFETEGFIYEDAHLSTQIETTVEAFQGTVVELVPDVPPNNRVLIGFSVHADGLRGSISVDLSASSARRIAQFPVGGY